MSFPVIMITIGSVMAGIGGLLLVWCMSKAAKLRRAEIDEAHIHSELQKLVAMNMGGVFLGFLGLGIVVVGVIMS